MENRKKVAIIDVSAFIFRAYYAIPPMTSPSGEAVNALYGFISMFFKVAARFPGYTFVAALDSKTETFRKEAYPEYKANRKTPEPELKSQFARIETVLEALNIPVFAKDGFEADDVIASFVHAHPELDITIISSDKDLMQLVTEKTLMFDAMKEKFIDIPAVIEKYGVEPSKMLDLLTLTGDTSDNIPGVPKVGPKTAAKLLNDYGSIEKIYESVDSLKPAMKQNFLESREQLKMSKFLVQLNTSIEFGCCDLSPWHGVNREKFRGLVSLFGFRSLEKKAEIAGYAEDNELSRTAEPQPASVTSEKVAPETENNKAPAPVTDWNNGDFLIEMGDELFGAMLDGEFYAGKNGLFRRASLSELEAGTRLYSFAVKDFLDAPFPKNVKLTDLQIAYFCHNSGEHGYSADEIAKLIGFEPEPGSSRAAFFAFLSTLRSVIGSMPDKSFLIDEIEMPHLEVIRKMEQNGIRVDLSKVGKIKQEFNDKINGLTRRMFEIAGGVFNPNSPKQLQEILFEKLALKGVKKTKNGYSTDHAALMTLAENNDSPLPGLIIENRMYSKLVSTYLVPISQLTDADRRLRTSYIVTYAATGRLASREPNLQNIPTRTEEGRKIRGLFVAEEGYRLISLDYSQIELRILAALSGEEQFIEAFNSGKDIHRQTASTIFGVSPDEVTGTMRSNAKAVNFGIIYGMQAYKLSMDTGVDISFAKKYIDDYFAHYPKIKNFIDTTIENAKRDGYVETLFGRRRYITEFESSNRNVIKSGERMAVNTVIQGTAADIIKLGTIAVDRMLGERFPKARILLQIHDELILEVPASECEEAAKLAAGAMIAAGRDLKVKFDVNYSAGDSWAELK